MPELPDVEAFRRELASALPDQRVRAVEVRDAGVLRNITVRRLERDLNGHRFDAPRRHGKWLILPTDGPALLVHSGMPGHPYYAPPGAPEEGWERLVVWLDRGELRYADQRKLRGVWLAAREDEVAQVMGRQGPDALGIDLRTFREALSRRRGRLKATLIDQSVFAGPGNLLTDEICWQARLHPSGSISDLDDADLRQLHATMRRVLRAAMRHGCVPGVARWLTGVRDDPDPSCPRCGTRLERSRTGGRTSLWCPRCQPQSRYLATAWSSCDASRNVFSYELHQAQMDDDRRRDGHRDLLTVNSGDSASPKRAAQHHLHRPGRRGGPRESGNLQDQ
jgi:formamidopyrimidine-DNA glycosylase